MTATAAASRDLSVGFAKLQGVDFEYYMQTYSITLGRSSKNSHVDVDLSTLGGGTNISRHHARIFYDFPRRRFALEVLGKNGCFVEGVHHLPASPPVKLDSQDLIQIGDTKFYFLLPTRSIFAFVVNTRAAGYDQIDDDDGDENDDEEDERVDAEDRGFMPAEAGVYNVPVGLVGNGGSSSRQLAKNPGARPMVGREADNYQLLELEEKDVVASVATVLSDFCGPEEWMPLANLHSALVEQFGNVWHHSRVRKYLTPEDWEPKESRERPWFGLLTLLRKYPEHFVITTRSNGKLTSEFVSLIALLS